MLIFPSFTVLNGRISANSRFVEYCYSLRSFSFLTTCISTFVFLNNNLFFYVSRTFTHWPRLQASSVLPFAITISGSFQLKSSTIITAFAPLFTDTVFLYIPFPEHVQVLRKNLLKDGKQQTPTQPSYAYYNRSAVTFNTLYFLVPASLVKVTSES